MPPETISAINAVCGLLERIGTWPIGSIVLVILFGPWVFSFLMTWRQQNQFKEMRQMYENNVALAKALEKLADGFQDTVTLNTAKWTEAIGKIDTNQFCPSHRTRKIRMEDVSQ